MQSRKDKQKEDERTNKLRTDKGEGRWKLERTNRSKKKRLSPQLIKS